MHIAVDKGAPSNNTFKGFVDYLETNHHVTPAMKPWVDVIRQHGNIAVHELPHTDRERAIGTLTFTEQLLRNVYEMEYLAARFAPPTATPAPSP
jgi:Tfp pilus assembly protein FimV